MLLKFGEIKETAIEFKRRLISVIKANISKIIAINGFKIKKK